MTIYLFVIRRPHCPIAQHPFHLSWYVCLMAGVCFPCDTNRSPVCLYLEAEENRNVDLHQRLVLPKGGGLPGVQSHPVSNLLQEIEREMWDDGLHMNVSVTLTHVSCHSEKFIDENNTLFCASGNIFFVFRQQLCRIAHFHLPLQNTST